MYEYIGILLGAHPILRINRTRVKSDKRLQSTRRTVLSACLQSFLRRDLTNKYLILSQIGCCRQQLLQIFRFENVLR
jgi:hypothetical protein